MVQAKIAKNLLVTIEKNILIYGVIISTGYGVVTLEGLLIAFISEVFTTQSFSIGLVVNLYQNDTMNLLIGALLLNPRNPLDQGSTVHALSSLATIILGDCTIASILDPVGNLIFNSGRINMQYPWAIESPAPGIIDRQSVTEALQTGLIAIDSSIPIGCGQRELIVGDRQTGKTSISIDSILNQKYSTIHIHCLHLSWSKLIKHSTSLSIPCTKRCYFLPLNAHGHSQFICCPSILMCL